MAADKSNTNKFELLSENKENTVEEVSFKMENLIGDAVQNVLKDIMKGDPTKSPKSSKSNPKSKSNKHCGATNEQRKHWAYYRSSI